MTYNNEDFTGKNFSRMDLTGALFTNCNLSRTDFRYSVLSDVVFDRCDVTDINLSFADTRDFTAIKCKIGNGTYSGKNGVFANFYTYLPVYIVCSVILLFLAVVLLTIK